MANLSQEAASLSETTVILHHGELVLYKRPNYRNNVWQYRVRLRDGSYERKTTHRQDPQDATEYAEQRYQEVRYLEQKGIPVRGVAFKKACNDYCDYLTRQAMLRRKTKTAGIDRTINLVQRHIIPFTESLNITDVTVAKIEAYHEWYVHTWSHGSEHEHIVTRTRASTGMVYKTPIRLKIAKRSARKPGAAAIQFAQHAFNGIFALAVRNKHMALADQPHFDIQQIDRGRRGAFDEDEVARLLGSLTTLASMPASSKQETDNLLLLYVRFLLLTGLRPGKEPMLRFRDFTYKDGNRAHVIVHVRDGKTGPRRVLASNDLRAVIADIKKGSPLFGVGRNVPMRAAGGRVCQQASTPWL